MEDFKRFRNLETLTLQKNAIERLPRNIFKNLNNTRINLNDNPLWCDCQSAWLSEIAIKNHRIIGSCYYPEKLRHMKLSYIDVDMLNCEFPKILIHPEETVVALGNEAFFRCKSYGNPQPYQMWYHNEFLLKTDKSSKFSILNDGTLMISNVTHSDVGLYHCAAQNAVGKIESDVARLRIKGRKKEGAEPPVFIVKPQSVEVLAGEFLTLKCAASGNPLPNITWFKNGVELVESSRVSHGGSGVLVIRDIRMADRAHYICVATNKHGSINSHASVEVFEKPTIIKRPRDKVTKLGEMVTFHCDTEGFPTPIVEWTLNGHPTPRVFGDPHISFELDAAMLRILGVQKSDLGVYQCKASNSVGSVVRRATLSIKEPDIPVFSVTPYDVVAPQKSTVSFKCSARGSPEPYILWKHNNRTIHSSKKFYVERGLLKINDLSLNDSGIYLCEASNAAGSINTYAKLFVTNQVAKKAEVDTKVLNFTIKEAMKSVESAVDKTVEQLQSGRSRTPNELLDLFRRPSHLVRSLSGPADILERTLEILVNKLEGTQLKNVTNKAKNLDITEENVFLLANLSGCMVSLYEPSCSRLCYHNKFRSINGSCNNYQKTTFGAALTPLIRLLPAQYDNGWTTPRGWNEEKLHNGFQLASARAISIAFTKHRNTVHDKYSHMLMQWGQFLDHDITFTPQAASLARFSDGRFCNESCSNEAPCFPIRIPDDDPRILRRKCMGFTRSSAICSSGLTSILTGQVSFREQINQITGWIDASNVYGSDEDETRMLRDLYSDSGLLKEGIYLNGKPLLPYHEGRGAIDCQVDPNSAHIPCFHAGDHRSNEQLGLLSMHTIFFREHNRIAKRLKSLNVRWDKEFSFYETRKIVGALMQHITYKQWLPKVIGIKGMKLLGEYKGYNPTVDPSISNEFATAAFRFGHTLIQPQLLRLNSTFDEDTHGHLSLHRAFFAPFRLLEEGGIDPILRGLFHSKLKRPDGGLNKELTEKLFKFAHRIALDLLALNIQRGRDHGLPPYVKYREKFGLSPVRSFRDLSEIVQDPSMITLLEEVYGSVENIDLYIGGILEKYPEDALIGDTFLHILVDQFKRLRDGDRFWYEKEGVFTKDQLAQIQLTTLDGIICENSDNIKNVTKDVFIFSKNFTDCKAVPKMSFEPWAECCTDCKNAGQFFVQTTDKYSTKSRRKRSTDTVNDDEDVMETVDLVDRRIEGMEMAMSEMKMRVRSMYRKYQNLEKRLRRA
ncbi:DgyrCDS954 [Dimorphilus gyrociliatus]|uniref:Cell adhesion molecule-related/down-regulated by oncogenes n=1 Tax=Dimorphilus gyrociliatus TaxID=2664684 RepID=A0A7I8V8Q1_9ANNE|nr:DgyrCDS954 [Dimorphilus gyrociliatus]